MDPIFYLSKKKTFIKNRLGEILDNLLRINMPKQSVEVNCFYLFFFNR